VVLISSAPRLGVVSRPGGRVPSAFHRHLPGQAGSYSQQEADPGAGPAHAGPGLGPDQAAGPADAPGDTTTARWSTPTAYYSLFRELFTTPEG
jgi:hypothetical protein